MKSLGMRFMVHCGGCNIGVNEEGIYFSVFPLYRFAHPPLFIPWFDIHSIEKTKDMFIFEFYKIRFKQNPDIPLLIGKRLGDKIFNEYKTRIQVASQLLN
ncbi:MAG: hypothetical protein ACE14V_00130 [bacterium]